MTQRYWQVILITLVAILLLPSALAQESTTLDLERIQRATVYVIQAEDIGGRLTTTCVGSGTIVRSDGLVLTNAHNTVANDNCPGDILIIALSTRLDEPPVPRYRASIVQANIGVDLAVLRIDRELDGKLIDPENFPPLPFVNLADTDDSQVDETITVVGYPGIGNDAVTSIRGTITGFLAEPTGGDKSWIKTNALIPGIVSGGGAYNLEGRLIGVPTNAPVVIADNSESCQYIEDTNQDGQINTFDRCVPIGDNITSIRPADFARPLIRAASLNLSVDLLSLPTQLGTFGIEQPSFSNLFFSPAVVNGQPTTVEPNFPAGTTSLYLFFDYANMTQETVYELRVSIDGVPDETFGLSPARWSGGENGLWHIGANNQNWRNGTYDFRLFIDGQVAASARVVIGGATEEQPTFRNIVFGIEDAFGNPVFNNGFVLPTGSIVRARFIYLNMSPSDIWTAIWYNDGREIAGARTEGPWEDETNGSATTGLQPEGGLRPGNYRLDLYINSRLSARSDFVIAGAFDGAIPRVFVNNRFAQGNNPGEAVQAQPSEEFSSGLNAIYSIFDWQEIADGTLWTMRWLVDNEIFFEETRPWQGATSGTDFVTQLSAVANLPDGTYQLDLLVNDVLLTTQTARVGIGQLPIDRLTQAEGAQLRGRIIDEVTGEGIQGATFILITEEFSAEEFLEEWSQEQVYAIAVTDRNGDFEISRPLVFDAPYSIMIAVDGYLPIAADGYIIRPIDPNPLEIVVPLTRD